MPYEIDDKEFMKMECQEALDSVKGVLYFLDTYAEQQGETFWKDKDGDEFSGDMGYLYEGLEAFIEYLNKKMEKKEARND